MINMEEEKLRQEIYKLEEELAKKKKQLSDKIETVRVYFHNDYNYEEVAETYPSLSDEQIEELYNACYEVELIYNFKTLKFEIPKDD